MYTDGGVIRCLSFDIFRTNVDHFRFYIKVDFSGFLTVYSPEVVFRVHSDASRFILALQSLKSILKISKNRKLKHRNVV